MNSFNEYYNKLKNQMFFTGKELYEFYPIVSDTKLWLMLYLISPFSLIKDN